MAQLKIDITDLKNEGGSVIEELTDFIKKKTEAEVKTTANEILVKTDEETISKPYMRVLVRKFLHKTELKDYFKVIGGKEDTLTVKERKSAEEE